MRRGGPIRTYRDLILWQRAIHLLVATHRVIRRIPAPERFDFGPQMRRAALSISSNIAEGFGRDHLGDFLRQLSVARGSAMEVESDLLALQALSLVPRAELMPVLALANEVIRMGASLAHKLRSRSPARRGPPSYFTRNE